MVRKKIEGSTSKHKETTLLQKIKKNDLKWLGQIVPIPPIWWFGTPKEVFTHFFVLFSKEHDHL